MFNGYGQEILTGIEGNPVLANKSKKTHLGLTKNLVPINLPFIEDFSGESVYPDTSHWEDSSAYINTHFAQYSIGVGIATLDGTDEYGNLYSISLGETHRTGDKLTSRQINLNYLPQDSIYLSFFYQAGGLGDKPELNDSLIVDLYNGAQWTKVWSTQGAITDNEWRQAMIPIKDETYMTDEFKFRIRNIISPSGGGVIGTNCDMWNIDFVRLDIDRNSTDTTISDIAITRNPNSILSQYSAIPLSQYKSDPYYQHSTIDFYFTNHDSISNQITWVYRIQQTNSEVEAPWINNGTLNFQPSQIVEMNIPARDYPFLMPNADSIEYLLETKLIGSNNYLGINTTGKKLHKFSNYYAYDDGTAENGYDVNTPGGQVAVRYETYMPDSLRGAYMYFNPTNDSSYNTNYFSLCVWSDDGGIPGRLIYSKSGFTPTFNAQYPATKLMFDSAIYVSGNFFIGWTKGTNKLLSVGYDLNTRTSQKNFYNLGFQWLPSSYNNAIMIRPILNSNPIVAVSDHEIEEEKPMAYPIPTNSYLNISYPDQKRPWTIQINDLSGRTILQEQRPNIIDCSNFNPGIYLITFMEQRDRFFQKIIIQ